MNKNIIYLQYGFNNIPEFAEVIKYLEVRDSQEQIYFRIDPKKGLIVSERENASTPVEINEYITVIFNRHWGNILLTDYPKIARFLQKLNARVGGNLSGAIAKVREQYKRQILEKYVISYPRKIEERANIPNGRDSNY